MRKFLDFFLRYNFKGFLKRIFFYKDSFNSHIYNI